MTDSTLSPSKRHQLRFDAGPYGPAFESLCASEGVKPQAMLKRLVAEKLSAERPGNAPKPRVQQGELDASRHRMTLRFTSSELKILEAAAVRSGSTIQAYIISVARAHAADARVGQEERHLLGQLNYQILSIGRNINQIAYRANALDGVSQQQLDELSSLERSLKVIVHEVHKHVLSGRMRWKIISN